MPVKIKNLTNRPVLMRLNSGISLHLSPGTTSSEIVDVEVSNNEKVRKLQGRRVIAMEVCQKGTQETSVPKRTGESAKRKK